MPLSVLLILVIGGIAAIAGLLHLTGRSGRARLTSDTVRAAWARHFPEDTVDEVLLARDGHAALVRTGQGPGLLWAFGADTVARHLGSCDLVPHPRGLQVRFGDFTAPRVTLDLQEDERDIWSARMTRR